MNPLELHSKAQDLPAFQIAEQVNLQLQQHNNLVITAPPGAGKSTLLPLTISSEFPDGKVLVLEPRRLAARQIAERMAWMIGEEVGKTVGYRIRFENCISQQTRIEIITEGILTRMLIDDPTLEGVSVIIFDEFHERSLTSDVALALSREAQQIIRPDLKLVIMSATIDTQFICSQLNAPLVESDGKMFPVDIRYCGDLPWHDYKEALKEIVRKILEAHRQEEGDILVFLPGESEIRQCQELLGSSLENTRVFPLYGMLSSQEQRMALAPSAVGQRKIVLATPIAETSLTIQGIRVVIDAGLCRKMRFNARTGLSHLETVPISMDMARQRCGRAGRVTDGVCYRLWSKTAELHMPDCSIPEIEEADLAPMMLEVAAWGESQVEHLPWITPPPRLHLIQALELLQALKAVNPNGQITPHGKQLVKLPCHPRISQLLVTAHDKVQKALAADVAALLESSTSLPLKAAGADLNVYVAELQHHKKRDNGPWDRIVKASNHYFRLACSIASDEDLSSVVNQDKISVGSLIASAYPERIARAQKEGIGRFRMANGKKATVDTNDNLAGSDWIAIAHMNALGNGRVFLGAPVSMEQLNDYAQERLNLNWDNKQGCLVSSKDLRIGSLILSTRPLQDISEEQIIQVLSDAAPKWGTSMFDFSDKVQELQERISTVADWHPELELPDLSTQAVLARTQEWLPYYRGNARNTSDLKKIDLCQVLWGLLSYDQQQEVDRLAPSHVQLPNGHLIRIEYRQGAELPIVRVRLQECFGMQQTPRVDDGRRALLMELLSPGFKPVQLTQDLQSFWSGTYFEVRKELRRRYPKHAWPEDPTTLFQ